MPVLIWVRNLTLAFLLAGCGAVVIRPPIPSPYLSPPPVANGCAVSDQVQYVYHPQRLEVLQPCIHVSGIVQAVRQEADGDIHIELALDTRYRNLLSPANQQYQNGNLVVEPVCVNVPTQLDAKDICAQDQTMMKLLPHLQDHIWVEGQYVHDLQHHGWSEIHPLFRWSMM